MADYTLSNFRNYTIFTDQTGSAIYDTGGPTGSYATGENYYFLLAPSYSTGSLVVTVESASLNTTDKIRIYNGVPTTGTTASFNYTGTTTGSQLIAVITGTSGVARSFTASSGRAYVRFSGDTNGTAGAAAGFKLSWTGSGFYSVDSDSGVVYNKYGITFPTDGTSGSYMTFARGMLSSSSTLSSSKDIIIGFWAKQDKLPASAPEGPVFGVGTYNGGQGITVARMSSPAPGDSNFRIYYYDNSGSVSTLSTRAIDITNGGQLNLYSYPSQWNHYGFVIRKTGANTGEFLSYKDGVIFGSSSITKATNWGNITSSYDTVLGSFRDSTTGLILSGGATKAGWSGSLDDVFLATADFGSVKSEYSTLFSRIYNSGNWSDPNIEITGAISSSLNPRVIFNWRFEETGSLLNTKDYGYYGNYHTASTTGNIANESVRLTFTSSGVSYTPYSNLAYSASVKSNIVVSFTTQSSSVYENTSSYIFSVQVLTASVGQSATASITTGSMDATAFLGTDFTLRSNGTVYSSSAQLPIYVSWSASDTTTKYITASILDNTTYTGTSSSFSLFIQTGSSTNVSTQTPFFSTLNILDYEEGYASFSSSSYYTGESSGSVQITVNRISGSSGPLSVNYSTFDNTALSGTNYVSTTGTLSWADGITGSNTIMIPIIYDNVYSPNLNFYVGLYGLSTGSYSSYPSAITSSTVSIEDQEPGTFNWQITSLSVYETGSSATVNVTRESGTFGTVEVQLFYSSSQGTVNPKTGSAGSLLFTSGETSEQATFVITDDLIDEVDDPIYITFSSFSSSAGTAKSGSNGTLILTIIDNETGSISFSGSSATIFENTSSYYVGVQRLYGGDYAATASINFSGDAVLNTDYKIIYDSIERTSSFNIVWASGSTETKYITASILDNTISNGFRDVDFSIVSSSISIGPSSSFNLIIADYEEGYPSFQSSSYSTGESSGSVLVYVSRISGSNGPLSVNYETLNGTAISGTNYTKTTGTLNWIDGVSGSNSITIPILYDGVQTENKTFTVRLYNLSTGSFSSYPSAITSSTITIIDQEPGLFRFSSSSYSVIEGNNLTVQVERISGSFNVVTMNVTSSGGTAATVSDYTAVNQALTFSNGELSKTFTVSTVDNANNVTEQLYFNLGFSNISASNGTSSTANPSTASVYIVDNESGSVRFTAFSHTGSQNSSIIVSVERYNGGDFAATASVYVSSSSTAVAGLDYTNIFPYTLNWNDQVSGSKSFTISTLAPWNDSRILNLYISDLTNIASGSTMSASVLISSNTITQSTPPLQETSKDYVINSYGNLSYEFTRRTEQVPFFLNKKGMGKLR